MKHESWDFMIHTSCFLIHFPLKTPKRELDQLLIDVVLQLSDEDGNAQNPADTSVKEADAKEVNTAVNA